MMRIGRGKVGGGTKVVGVAMGTRGSGRCGTMLRPRAPPPPPNPPTGPLQTQRRPFSPRCARPRRQPPPASSTSMSSAPPTPPRCAPQSTSSRRRRPPARAQTRPPTHPRTNACARARVRARVRACVRARVRAHAHISSSAAPLCNPASTTRLIAQGHPIPTTWPHEPPCTPSASRIARARFAA